jgi:hypothetical protein
MSRLDRWQSRPSLTWPTGPGFLRQSKWLDNNLQFNFRDILNIFSALYPNVAKVGGLQSQGVKGEAVAAYCDPLTTQNLKSSGFPAGETTRQNRPHLWSTPMAISTNYSDSYEIRNNYGPLTYLCLVVYATKGCILLPLVSSYFRYNFEGLKGIKR